MRVFPVGCLAVCLVATACRPDRPITNLDLGLRASTDQLDFGRALEGSVVFRTLTVTSETRATVSAAVLTESAFFAAPGSVEVVGGGEVELPVRFNAGVGEANGTLTIRAGEHALRLSLRGVGVRPLVCVPSAACRTSSYSLEEDRCVEVQAPDQAPCDPGNLCLDQGRCRGGACVGVPRSCDDRDECTTDGCSPSVGCVNVPRVCPSPGVLCHVAVCDPQRGCGSGPASDGTPCGAVDCATASLCLLGVCRVLPTPEGFPCAPPIACIGRGECRSQRCVRPDAGVWTSTWSAPLRYAPIEERPALLSQSGNIFFGACGLPAPDGGGDDGGGDGGNDGGRDDGGTDGGDDGGDDGGSGDGGSDGGDDGGSGDGGSDGGHDGGSDDGGSDGGDAGWPWDGGVCGLVSYTSTGFDRFTVTFADPEPRSLALVNARGVLLRSDAGFELRSRVSGEVVGALRGEAPRRGEAASFSDGTIATVRRLNDGGTGLMLWTDGGVDVWAELALAQALLAVDERGDLQLWDPLNGRFARMVPSDGGLEGVGLDAGQASLALAGGHLAVGLTQLVEWNATGARVVPLEWGLPDGGAQEPLTHGVLMTSETLLVFYRQCSSPSMSCPEAAKETWARALDSHTGALKWETLVLPGSANARLLEAALVDATPYAGGAFVTLSHGEVSGIRRAVLQLHADGRRVLACPLPEGSADVRGALFSGTQMLALVARADGGFALEAYPLTGIPLLTSGWPQSDAVGGERRALP